MSSNYQAPANLRDFEKMFSNFTYQNGFDASRVFDDFLTYIIQGYCPNASELNDWKYTKEQNAFFYKLYSEWLKIMDAELSNDKGWYDAFGNLYEAIIASNGRQNLGQFFTPEHICDLMIAITYPHGDTIVNQRVGDPSCGSGRTLLSFHIKHPGNYLVGEDIDRTCAMMTVCNFLIHGVVGEVVWHDSLDPGSWFGGWVVNEHLNDKHHKWWGLPHIRKISQEESSVWQHWEQVKCN